MVTDPLGAAYVACGIAVVGLLVGLAYRDERLAPPKSTTEAVVDVYAITISVLLWPVLLTYLVAVNARR